LFHRLYGHRWTAIDFEKDRGSGGYAVDELHWIY
jgi:hypothetical protein